jgi:hypothetical protein
MSGLLSPERRETFIGNAEILESLQHHQGRQGRRLPRHGRQGRARRGRPPDPRRRRHPRRQAEDAQALQGRGFGSGPVGQECGMAFENYEDIQRRRHHRVLPCGTTRTAMPQSLGAFQPGTGANPTNLAAQRSSLPLRRPTMSTALYCRWTVAGSPADPPKACHCRSDAAMACTESEVHRQDLIRIVGFKIYLLPTKVMFIIERP